MSIAHHTWPHRQAAGRASGEVRARTIVEGLVALVALVALLGALAGAATWGVVQLLANVVG